MRLLNADSVQFFAWNRENETCEKRRKTDYLLNGDAPHNNHLRERLTFLAQELEKITATSRYGDRKSKILFFNAQKRGRIGKRFSI